MKELEDKFKLILERIYEAGSIAGRNSSDLFLVAVTKKQPIEKIVHYINFCAKNNIKVILGENYVQEWQNKKLQLDSSIRPVPSSYETHLIGHLQTNKLKLALPLFSDLQSVDSKKLIEKIISIKATEEIKNNIWLQINISKDSVKHGMPADDCWRMVELLLTNNLKFKGLMTITQNYHDPRLAQKDYAKLYKLGEKIKSGFNLSTVALSMGMSNDFELAIKEGATHVRIGTALFGER